MGDDKIVTLRPHSLPQKLRRAEIGGRLHFLLKGQFNFPIYMRRVCRDSSTSDVCLPAETLKLKQIWEMKISDVAVG